MNDEQQPVAANGSDLPDRDVLAAFMREEAYKPLTLTELAAIFGVPRGARREFGTLLESMEADGLVVRTRTDRYGAPERMNLVVGRLQAHARGFGFVIPDRGGGDLFVSAGNLGGAMHKDRVVARIRSGTAGQTGSRRQEGEIIRILKRANARVVGVLERTRRYGFVTPADPRLGADVFVPKSELSGALSGEVVVVEVTRWPERRRSAEGRVVERLGRRDEPGVDVTVIMVKHGLEPDFPPGVQEEAEAVPDRVLPGEERGRLDLRSLPTVTIDGADARDLDDAVSLEPLDNPGSGGARWRLGVHIADVSHYVREGSSLDGEARRRGTSVYLVDRVVPMLPSRLSNGICSLNPRVDRLALSVLMDVDERGRVLDHRIVPSVIHVDERLTYDAVQAMLSGNDDGLRGRYDRVLPMLQNMHRIAANRFKERLQRGSIDFDFPEAKVILDDEGRPVEVRPYRRNAATQLIEEFMILCNETVAEHFKKNSTPFLYRVHEPPAPDAVETFEDFAALFGYRPQKRDGDVTPADFQAVLEQVEGRPEQALISTVMLRTMQRARYATENLGHFGLASGYYAHFTSPIRRYPDLVIHRIIKESLAGRLTPRRTAELIRDLPDVAADCSVAERAAEEAERESVDLKKAEYMEQHLGEVFEGTISGVTQFGLFVQLPNTVEGLVHVSTMTDDYYHFDEERYTLTGERSGRRFRLGDRISVQLIRVDLDNRSVDFRLHEGDAAAAGGGSVTGGRSGAGAGDRSKAGAGGRPRPGAGGRPKAGAGGRSKAGAGGRSKAGAGGRSKAGGSGRPKAESGSPSSPGGRSRAAGEQPSTGPQRGQTRKGRAGGNRKGGGRRNRPAKR